MLDNWTIKDANERWDFLVEITAEDDNVRPEQVDNAYSGAAMLKEGRKQDAQWAWDAVAAWESGSWKFATIRVTPVLRSTGIPFESARMEVQKCSYGFLPDVYPKKRIQTSSRNYVRVIWVNRLLKESKNSADEQLAKILKAAK